MQGFLKNNRYILISSDLSWNNHIDSITAKANRMLGFLKRNYTKYLPPRAVRSLFIALVRPHLGYCNQVWAPQSVIRNIKLIDAVQRRATTFICKTSTDLTYRNHLIFIHLLPLNYWLEYLDLVGFFYKCKANDVRNDLDNYINFCSGRTSTCRCWTVSQTKCDTTNVNLQRLFF